MLRASSCAALCPAPCSPTPAARAAGARAARRALCLPPRRRHRPRRRARHLHRCPRTATIRARGGSRSASSASARPIPIPARRSSIWPAGRAARASPPRAGRASRSSSRLRAGRRRDRARPARHRLLQPYPALHGRAPARSGAGAERGDADRLLSRDARPLRRPLARRRRGGERLYDRAERRRSSRICGARSASASSICGGSPTARIWRWRRCAVIRARSAGSVFASADGHGPDGQAARPYRSPPSPGSTRRWPASSSRGCAGSMPASTPSRRASRSPARRAA